MFHTCLLVLTFLPYVHSISLTSSSDQLKAPGESVKLSCQASGYALTDYGTGWIRQRSGKPLEWIGIIWGGGSINLGASFQSRFTISRDSSNVLYLDISRLQAEDTAVYYCAKTTGTYYFDYWGKGTEVTVTSATATAPTLFPLAQCGSGTKDMLTLGCMATGFTPPSITFKWKDSTTTALTDFIQYPSVQSNGKYMGVSQLSVKKADWEKRNFICAVEHSTGPKDVVFKKPVSEPMTVILNPPKVYNLFVNHQAVLECVINGKNTNAVRNARIAWNVNKQSRRDGISEVVKNDQQTPRKVSTLTLNRRDWGTVNTVQCSAESNGITTGNQELVINHGCEGYSVSANILSEESMNDKGVVTLVCLVVSPSLCDFYILWKEGSTPQDEQNSEVVTNPPQKTHSGSYTITSIFTTSKGKWDNNVKFSCSVTHAGLDTGTGPREISVSKPSVSEPMTVILNPPKVYNLFVNHQAVLECVINGKNTNAVRNARIAWNVNKQSRRDGISEVVKNDQQTPRKVSTLTLNRRDWGTVNTVQCSAESNGITTGNQELVINHGCEGYSVSANILSEESMNDKGVVTLVCLVVSPSLCDFYILWKEGSTPQDEQNSEVVTNPPQKTHSGSYTITSIFTTSKGKWDNNVKFSCSVTHAGLDTGTGPREISVSKPSVPEPMTVTLNPPRAYSLFVNHQAVLECVINGKNTNAVRNARIAWNVNKQSRRDGISEVVKNDQQTPRKVSTLTLNRRDWGTVNTVQCSAESNGITTGNQELVINHGCKGYSVSANILSEESMNDKGVVTLVCLVVSPSLCDFYILWKEGSTPQDEQNSEVVTNPPQKTHSGSYTITSIFTTSKGKWDNNVKFSCSVTHAGLDTGTGPREISVSKPSVPEPMTVTLNPPRVYSLFVNHQAVLECVINGKNTNAVRNVRIAWNVNKQSRREGISEVVKNDQQTPRKVSTLTLNRRDWGTVNTVQCSAESNGITTGNQELVINHGCKGYSVSAHILSEESMNDKGVVTLVCLVVSPSLCDFYILWKEGSTPQDEQNSEVVTNPPQKTHSGSYTITSIFTTSKGKWDNNVKFSCSVTHAGLDTGTAPREISVSKPSVPEPMTVTLNPPRVYSLFVNHQAVLECVINGKNTNAVRNARIAWNVNKQSRRDGISEVVKNDQQTPRKVSTLTLNRRDWGTVNTVQCSAESNGITTGNQELVINHGCKDFSVSAHILPEEYMNDKGVVTLVCLVVSPSLCDFYILWKEGSTPQDEQNREVVTGPPQKTHSGSYTITSIFTTSKGKWDNNVKFSCSVTHAGLDTGTGPREISVSKPSVSEPMTVTLNPPRVYSLFVNHQAVLECVINGKNTNAVRNARIAWNVNKQSRREGISEVVKNDQQTPRKVSTLTLNRRDWGTVNTVQCSAESNGITTGNQELVINHGCKDFSVSAHILPEEYMNDKGVVTLVCLVVSPSLCDFYILWKEGSTPQDEQNREVVTGPPQKTHSGSYTITSIFTTSKGKWDNNVKFSCSVTHSGLDTGTGPREISVSKASVPKPMTVTLNPPKVYNLFVNHQAVLECVINGKNTNAVRNARITWNVNKQSRRDGISEVVKNEQQKPRKVSTLTLNRRDWGTVNTVQCSAESNGIKTGIQELVVNHGCKDFSVSAHILPEGSMNDKGVVTLVCLVVSPSLCDFYILWKEGSTPQDEQNREVVTGPPQKTLSGSYTITSIFTTSKGKWDNNVKFSCSVTHAGLDTDTAPREISLSKALEKNQLPMPDGDSVTECNKMDDEEDEFRSLWSTASIFIILFSLSITYSAVISLVKMKP
ncbi:uncharacterized protein LOC105008122 isoform X3 [Esox lucius]|uniref:uncharacterized protein LOC105008122 isoform X3 n=1 Tax=Esox lucius TaxID=8010 RepID=UPI001476B9E3|nr:uncharacterized protein LOC105008122 isoform X3 [Esox lucius]